jgi:hypothetical protein
MFIDWLARIYHALISFYPADYHSEFGEEMQEVFVQAAAGARQRGILALLSFWFHELATLPSAVVLARSGKNGSASLGGIQPVPDNLFRHPWQELILALAVFLLPAGVLLTIPSEQARFISNLWTAGIFLVIMLLIGWLGGLPLWSISYFGVVLVVGGYLYLFQWVVGLVTPALISDLSPGPWDHSTYLLLKIASTGLLWLMVFCLTLLVIALLMALNRFQPLLGRIRQDWTLLSYVFYGESIFALLILFKTQRFQANYVALGMLCLLAGIWFYQRCPKPGSRLLALIACLTLAFAIAVFHRQPFAPSNLELAWGGLFAPQTGRWLSTWTWMVLVMLLPGWLARWSSHRTSPQPDSR